MEWLDEGPRYAVLSIRQQGCSLFWRARQVMQPGLCKGCQPTFYFSFVARGPGPQLRPRRAPALKHARGTTTASAPAAAQPCFAKQCCGSAHKTVERRGSVAKCGSRRIRVRHASA
jgi:hypothetical protein